MQFTLPLYRATSTLPIIKRASLITQSSSVSKGSIGSFHLPLRKLVLHYSETNASSSGLRSLLLSPNFLELIQTRPSIEFVISPLSSHRSPHLIAFYSKSSKVIDLKNLDQNQSFNVIQKCIQSSGDSTKSVKRNPVVSKSLSVRGIWSPFHTAESKKH